MRTQRRRPWTGSSSSRAHPPTKIAECLRETHDYLIQRGLAADNPDARKLLRTLLELQARFPEERVSVARGAKCCYLSRRALGRRLDKAGLPKPSRILAFARILNTARLLRRPGCTIAEAAYRTGWPDPFSFSNATVRLTGLRPSEARERGLVPLAERWLQAELEEGSAELREPKPPECPSCGQEIEVAGENPADRSQLALSLSAAST